MNLKKLVYRLTVLTLAIFWAPHALAEEKANQEKPVTVPRVDLERYMGKWYEISKIPNKFQKQCSSSTTATYTLKEDGKIEVVNQCLTDKGETDQAKGVAKVEDRETGAKLKVSFVSFLGIRPFWGDYWILGLGEEYEYAVVGSPDRKYGWVLSRTPTLAPEILEEIDGILVRQGYDPASFEPMPQAQ